MKLLKALLAVFATILLYLYFFQPEFFPVAIILLALFGFLAFLRFIGNKGEPEGLTAEERARHHLGEENHYLRSVIQKRKNTHESVDRGDHDPIKIPWTKISGWIFFAFLILFVSLIIFFALKGEGYIQSAKKLESDQVIPINGGEYNLKPRTGSTLDMSNLTYYKGEPLYYVTQQVLMCGFDGGEQAQVNLATNGDLTISNVTGVKTKVTTPPSLPGTVIVECGEPGVYLIGFAPKP